MRLELSGMRGTRTDTRTLSTYQQAVLALRVARKGSVPAGARYAPDADGDHHAARLRHGRELQPGGQLPDGQCDRCRPDLHGTGIRFGIGADWTCGDGFRLMDAAETAQRLAYSAQTGEARE